MKTLILIAILLSGCATVPCDDPPDFYDRNGAACWRELDFIWCDDGYDSGLEENQAEPQAKATANGFATAMTIQYQYQYHSHVWSKQSEWTDDNGKKVCTWACFSDSSHVAVTSGYGYCPYPT